MEISEDDFEQFCTDLADALPEFTNVRRFGRRGDEQDGIDAAGDRAGKHVGFQHRRVKDFGPKAFETTVTETEYPADEYVLTLGSRASAPLRKAVRKASGWELWDADDIARRVRQLSDASARRLLETYFGAHWRQRFLGRTGPAAFHTVEEHFAPYMREGLLFDHRLALVGREDVLAEIGAFVTDPALSVVVLSGRGGIGKSRILKAAAEEIRPNGWTVLFGDEATPFDANSLDDIPPAPCLLFVDDAHRRSDLEQLIAFLVRRHFPTKLVLATRPEGRAALLSALHHSAVDARSVRWLHDLGELPRDKGEQLALAALEGEYPQLARSLYFATRDNPMVTVVGARLLRQQQIPPGLLERNQGFRDTVLVGFRDAALGRVSDRVPTEVSRRTLELVSALQPLYDENDELRRRAADFLGIRPSDFIRALDELQRAGVLRRRGYGLLVMPDVLADYVLGAACLTDRGLPTGYADELFGHFADLSFDRLLANLAEVDWRFRASSGTGTPLLDDIWKAFVDRFQRADNVERQRLLGMLRSAAPYQPKRILDLAEWTMSNPAADGAAHDLRVDRHEAVISMLPTLIEASAYGEYLAQACDLLWKLGRNDGRPKNQFPDHPIRVLARIAEYSPTTPLEVNAQVAEQAIGWLDDPGLSSYVNSPMDILGSLLVKEGLDPQSDERQIHFGHVQVNPDATRRLRSRIIERTLEVVVAGPPRVALRAVALLEGTLSDPIGFFGRRVSHQEKQGWEEEQLQILEGLRRAITTVPSPFVQLKIRDSVRWAAARGHSDAIRQGAKAIRAALTDQFELDLTRALMTPWFWDRDMEIGFDPASAEAERIQRLRGVAKEATSRWPEAVEMAASIDARLEALLGAGVSPEPGYLLALISAGDQRTALGLAQYILDHPGRPIEMVLSAVLRELRKFDEDTAVDIAGKALSSHRESLKRQIASLYGFAPWTESIRERDRLLLMDLLTDESSTLRSIALGGVGVLAREDVDGAKAIVIAADPGRDGQYAEALAGLLAPDGTLFTSLTDDELDLIIAKFQTVDSLDDHAVQMLMAAVAHRRPLIVAQMLLARIDAAGTRGGGLSYSPLPYEIPGAQWWSSLESGPRTEVLTFLRDSILPRTSERWPLVPELFGWVAADWLDDARAVLMDWLESGTPEKVMAAAQLLRRAPRDLIFDEPGFVGTVLSRAQAASPEAASVANAALHSATMNTSRHRRVGVGTPQDAWIIEKATSAAAALSVGSPSRSFYEDLARWAQQMMERMQKLDEESLDLA